MVGGGGSGDGGGGNRDGGEGAGWLESRASTVVSLGELRGGRRGGGGGVVCVCVVYETWLFFSFRP